MAKKKKKSNRLRILPTHFPQTYWIACRTPETEMDEFVPISHRGLNWRNSFIWLGIFIKHYEKILNFWIEWNLKESFEVHFKKKGVLVVLLKKLN